MEQNRDLAINRIKAIVAHLLTRYNLPTDSQGDQIYQKAYDEALDICASSGHDVFNPKEELKLTKELKDHFDKQFNPYGQRNY